MFAKNTGWEKAPRKLCQHKPQAHVTENIYIKNISLTWPTALRSSSNPAWEFFGFMIICQLKLWLWLLCFLRHEGKYGSMRAEDISPNRTRWERGLLRFLTKCMVAIVEAKAFLFTHWPFLCGEISPPLGEWDRIFAFSSWGLILGTRLLDWFK